MPTNHATTNPCPFPDWTELDLGETQSEDITSISRTGRSGVNLCETRSERDHGLLKVVPLGLQLAQLIAGPRVKLGLEAIKIDLRIG